MQLDVIDPGQAIVDAVTESPVPAILIVAVILAAAAAVTAVLVVKAKKRKANAENPAEEASDTKKE